MNGFESAFLPYRGAHRGWACAGARDIAALRARAA